MGIEIFSGISCSVSTSFMHVSAFLDLIREFKI